MKNILFLLVMLSLTMIACQKSPVIENSSPEIAAASGSGKNGNNNNQNAAVPEAVLQSFVAHFENVTVNQWKLRGDGTWRAHFINNGVAWEATFTASGVLVKSEPA